MSRSSHSCKRGKVLATSLVAAGGWLMATTPALAQGEETADLSMIERLLGQPDLAAPMVIPMILAFGGIFALMIFLAWVFLHLPNNSEA